MLSFLFVTNYLNWLGSGLLSISPAHPGFQDDSGGLKLDRKYSEMVFQNYSSKLSIQYHSKSTRPVRHAKSSRSQPQYSFPSRPGYSRFIAGILLVAIHLLYGDME